MPHVMAQLVTVEWEWVSIKDSIIGTTAALGVCGWHLLLKQSSQRLHNLPFHKYPNINYKQLPVCLLHLIYNDIYILPKKNLNIKICMIELFKIVSHLPNIKYHLIKHSKYLPV